MDRERASDADIVMSLLAREPWRFSLEQYVRLKQLAGQSADLLGDLSMAFAPSELTPLKDGRVQVRSQGPGGADGVLPYAWLEWFQQAAQDKNDAPQDFLHLFQRRFIQHHYRSLSLWRLATPYARQEQREGDKVLRALCGFAGAASSPTLSTLLAQSGLLADRRRSPAGFVALVAAALDVTVGIEEFVGRWQALPPSAQGKMGCHLGRDSVVGRRAWNQQALLRVHLQAGSEAQWRDFLPDGDGFRQLCALGRLWFGPGIELELAMTAILPLTQHLRRASPPRLGHTARLAGRRPQRFCCRLPLKEK